MSEDLTKIKRRIANRIKQFVELERKEEEIRAQLAPLQAMLKQAVEEKDTLRIDMRVLLQRTGMKRMAVSGGSIELRAPAKSVKIVDIELLPNDYVDIVKVAKKVQIKKDLTDGVEIPGAELEIGDPVLAVLPNREEE